MPKSHKRLFKFGVVTYCMARSQYRRSNGNLTNICLWRGSHMGLIIDAGAVRGGALIVLLDQLI